MLTLILVLVLVEVLAVAFLEEELPILHALVETEEVIWDNHSIWRNWTNNRNLVIAIAVEVSLGISSLPATIGLAAERAFEDIVVAHALVNPVPHNLVNQH